MNTSSEAIEKVATALAQRAFVVRNSPKSSVFADSLRESDVITKTASDILDRRVMEKQANPYNQATGWFKGLQPGTQQSMRNAAIGLGAGALGGAALNMMNTDKDDEDRHPFSSALTGALGGAALGGLGTLGLNQLNKHVMSDPNATDSAIAESLGTAENPGTSGLKGLFGRIFGTSESPARRPEDVGVPSALQRTLGAPFAAFSDDSLPLASGHIEGSGVTPYDDVRDILSQYTGGLGEPAMRIGGAAGLIESLRRMNNAPAIRNNPATMEMLQRGLQHLRKDPSASAITKMFPGNDPDDMFRRLINQSTRDNPLVRARIRLGDTLRDANFGSGKAGRFAEALRQSRVGQGLINRLSSRGDLPIVTHNGFRGVLTPERSRSILERLRNSARQNPLPASVENPGRLRRMAQTLGNRRVFGGVIPSVAALFGPEISAGIAGYGVTGDRAEAIRRDAARMQYLEQMRQNQRN